MITVLEAPGSSKPKYFPRGPEFLPPFLGASLRKKPYKCAAGSYLTDLSSSNNCNYSWEPRPSFRLRDDPDWVLYNETWKRFALCILLLSSLYFLFFPQEPSLSHSTGNSCFNQHGSLLAEQENQSLISRAERNAQKI